MIEYQTVFVCGTVVITMVAFLNMEKRYIDWNFTWWLILLLAHIIVVLSLIFINRMKDEASASRLNQNQRSMPRLFDGEAKSFNFPKLFRETN